MKTGTKKKATLVLEKQFAAAYVRHGRKGTKAIQAIDKAMAPQSAAVKATRLLKSDNVQRLIDEALVAHDLTIDSAVSELAKIVHQDE